MRRWIYSLLIVMYGVCSGSSAAQTDAPNFFPTDLGLALDFTVGADELSDAHKEMLRELIKLNESDGLRKAVVVAWGDEHSKGGAPVTARDSSLAKRRAEAVRLFLRTQSGLIDIETINMAEPVARDASRKELELKTGERELQDQRIAKSGARESARDVLENGGPRTVVVLIDETLASEDE